MGDIADMMIDGTLCEGCGAVFPDRQAPGYPRRCAECEPAVIHETAEISQEAFDKIAPPEYIYDEVIKGVHFKLHRSGTLLYNPGSGFEVSRAWRTFPHPKKRKNFRNLMKMWIRKGWLR